MTNRCCWRLCATCLALVAARALWTTGRAPPAPADLPDAVDDPAAPLRPCDVHFYLRRALSARSELGSAARHREAVAARLLRG